MFRFLLGGSVMALAGAAPAFAADTGKADVTMVAPVEAAEIVVIGNPDQLRRTPGSASIVSADDMRRSQLFSVNDALRMLPGVFARDEEGAGARPNIGIRGLNPIRSTKVLLLEDGIPLGFAPYGDNSAYYHPPVERFERIEILKGASQIRFGPQTIGGVINYITPDVSDTLSARGSIAGGSRSSWNLDGQINLPFAGGGVILHGNRKETAGNRDNQLLRFTDLSAKVSWAIGADHVLTLKVSRFAENSRVTYSGLTRAEFAANPRGNPFVNDEFETERWSTTLGHRWQLAEAVSMTTTAYYHNFQRDWWRQSSNSGQRPNDASDPACGGMANLSTGCGNEGRLRGYDTWGIESRVTIDHALMGLGAGGATEIGVRFHDEVQSRQQWNGDTPNARSPGVGVNGGVRENNRRDATAISAFAQTRLEFGPLALLPGVRGEFIRYNRINRPIDVIAGGRPTGAKTLESTGSSRLDKVIPGIAATTDLGSAVTLYGGVHRGFAPPRVEDIVNTTGGSVDLDAELSWNYEFGARGRVIPGITADATLFLMNFDNQIIAQSVAGGIGTQLTSAGRTLHRGAELGLTLSSRDAGATREMDIYGRLAATYVGTARFASTRVTTLPCFDGAATGALIATGSGARACGIAFDARDNRLPYSPEWLVTAAVGVEYKGFQGQVEITGQSTMFADDANTIPVTPDGQRGEIPGWAQVNLSVRYGPPAARWEVFATARNLFDKLYIVDRARGILPGQPQIFQGGVLFRY